MVQWSRLDDDHWGPFGFIMYFCLWYLHTFSGNSHTWSAKIAVMCWLLQVWRGCNVVTFVCCSFLLHRRKNLSTFELINRWNKWMNETRRKVHNLANMKLWQEWALKQLALRRWFRYVSVLQQFDFYIFIVRRRIITQFGLACLLQGKGSYTTYWLDGKQASFWSC